MSDRPSEEFKIEDVFESAVTIVKSLPKEGPIQPSNDLKLKLYAHYKQATCGPNTTPKPYIWQAVEYYKWHAWLKLGDMSREDAMSSYIMELKKIMDSIPKDKTDPDEGKHFEQVLGKKFYDYWFNQWEQKPDGPELTGSGQSSSAGQSSSGSMPPVVDTQSSSSTGSSMSMLEEAQAADADGYKTPNSVEQCNIVSGQMNDQFALALLRLQHSLDQTNGRLDKLETMVRQSLDGTHAGQNQTTPKRRLVAPESGHTRKPLVESCSRRLINLARHMGVVHWFYLSYPIVVYMVLRALERRRRSRPASR